jgi:nitrate reductase assembly molybdenum cofactor insertion protein NarJ
MNLLLPGLLRALAGILARPGGLPRDLLAEGGRAFWVSPDLKAALNRMLDSETPDLAVAYADAFLVSRDHPVLHLEASVQHTGLLRDPALLHDLDHHYAALGFDPPEGRSPDHLATELEAVAAGLQRLGGADTAELAHLVANLTGLIDLHLLPLLVELQRLARARHLHPTYAAALAAAASCVELVREGIFAFHD